MGLNILVAPDKFKGSLTAEEAVDAIRLGIERCYPSARIDPVPLADGGEGTASLLTRATNGRFFSQIVQDPLGRPVEASYGLSGDGQTAFIEMAQASGLYRLAPGERNPLLTSTYGTGQLIAAALAQGVDTIVLGIGGSATNDGGTGLAAALGYRFRNEAGELLNPTGGRLAEIAHIEAESILPQLRNVQIRVACDVDNPLCGPTGAAAIYGPQKGANSAMVERLDQGLRHLAQVVERDLGITSADEPGSGAAGGTGFGARVFLGAELTSGFSLVSTYLRLADRIRQANLVITGEGSLDEQTLSGKLIGGLTRLARRDQVPVIAFCGRLDLTPGQVKTLGLAGAYAITPAGLPFHEAVRRAPELLTATTVQVIQSHFSELNA